MTHHDPRAARQRAVATRTAVFFTAMLFLTPAAAREESPPPASLGGCDGSEDVDERDIDPECGAGGDPDGGCQANPPVFVSIQCGDRICGSSRYNGAVRDTDWFAVGTAPPGTRVRWSGVAAFDAQALIISDTAQGVCQITIEAFHFSPAGPYAVEHCFPGGAPAVYAWMGPQFNSAFPCGVEYSGQVDCLPFCDVSCPGDLDPCAAGHTIDERVFDPTCGLGGDPDGGCSTRPPLFLALACGDVVCGSVHFDGAARDADWFNLGGVAPGTRVTWSGVSEFDQQPILMSDDGVCQALTIDAFVFAPAGAFSIQHCYDAGAEAVYPWMGPQMTGVFDCGCEYRAGVDCSPCGGGCAACSADVTGDCCVNQSDLGALLAHFCGQNPGCAAPGTPGDYDGDLDVDQADLGTLLGQFGCTDGDCD